MSICGLDCCCECSRQAKCGGCEVTNGHPFEGNCIAAETIKSRGLSAFNDIEGKPNHGN